MGIEIKIGQRHQVVPAGEFLVRVTQISEGTFVGKRKSLEFHFEIAEGEHVGKVLRGFVNAHYESFSEYTKLRQWIIAVQKIDEEPGNKLDLDLFYQKVLRVKVDTKISKKTGNSFSNVTDVLGVACDLG